VEIADLRKETMSKESNAIRIVIAGEHPILRQDLRRSLESEPGLLIVGEASDACGANQLTRQFKPDILLIDFTLSQRFELQVLNDSASHSHPVRIVVMVTAIEKAHLVEAFRFGAHGIVLKTSTPRVLLNSLRSVMAGQYWLESESVAVLVQALRESLSQGNGAKSPKDYGLTPREVEIMTKIATGSSNRQVGEDFSISERTVKHHLTNIFTKIGVSSRLQLALFAVNHHLMSTPAPSLSLQTQPSDSDA
jgi:two-component system, NarL family, nitrate/nitrite response regulator NarL